MRAALRLLMPTQQVRFVPSISALVATTGIPGIHRSVDRLSNTLGIDRADDDAVRSCGDSVINKFLLPFGILKFADGVGDFNIKADLIVYALLDTRP